ncbi:MAG: protein-L-isoaspartate O-methyltransferase [Pseudomonadota bacterium]
MKDFRARRQIMVNSQVRPADVTKFPIIEAMLNVPRELFVPVRRREAAYVGDQVDLGNGRVMLEPRTLAKILDALNITAADAVLDIGAGLGYSTAVTARMAELVVAVEEDKDTAEEAAALLMEAGVDNAIVHQAELRDGAEEHGPYDVIMVQGGVEHVPNTILDQLKEGGRIACIFMTGDLGTVKIGRKSAGRMSWRYEFNAGAPVLPGYQSEREFAL